MKLIIQGRESDGVSEIICSNCVLPENFPGIRFDEKGVCNYCLDYQKKVPQPGKKLEFSQKFESLIEKYRGKNSYDALMCYSGGKDSTYTLLILKEKYHLNPLALSFDNGFLPQQALNNIRNVVEGLGVDHILLKPRFDILAKVFSYCAQHDTYSPKALERSSAICTSCMAILKYSALRLAIEKDIPFIVYGWSPGQAPITSSILLNNPQMLKSLQKVLYDRLYAILGDDIRPYFLEEKHFTDRYNFPYNINPLSFLDYNIDNIYKSISRFGWKKPEGVDANSTNCLLNSFANYMHKQKLGFHPYAFELANLVREGYLDRTTAIKRLREEEDPHTIAKVKEKINRSESGS
jgi:tRNA(Ile)-lysidine synthase TilS/MesJ